MKKTFLVPLLVSLFFNVLALAEEVKLGKPVSIDSVTSIHAILGDPENYVGKMVRVEGTITEVCQMMGCWIEVRETGSQARIRVKVNDGEMVFPKDGVGKKVVAQGEVEKTVMTRDQYVAFLKHEAEESGKAIDSSEIQGGKTIYRIKGKGAVIHQ